MSCRNTRAGSVATTFLATYFDLEDSQATSIFHKLRRERGESNISDEQFLSSLDDLEELIRTSPKFNRGGVRERGLARVQEARDELTPTQDIRYALSLSSREGTITTQVIRGWTAAYDDTTPTNGGRYGIDDPYAEFQRLAKEYRRAKIENPSDVSYLITTYELPELFPADNASRYAAAVISRRSRCRNCGQFLGSLAHACPTNPNGQPLSSAPIASSETPVAQNSSPSNNFGVTTQSIEYDVIADEHIVSIEEFQELYDSVRAKIAAGEPYLLEVPYDTPGSVTGRLGAPQGGRSIGLELEMDFPDEDYPYFEARHELASALYREGLTLSPYVERWHYVGDDRPGGDFRVTPAEWICEFDRSVDPYEGDRGLEIKSQILFDTPETWTNLKTICTHANRLGAEPTQRTGLHINMGANDFSANNPERHNRLLKLAAVFDDTLVRIAHNPASGTWHRGRAYCGYASVPAEGFQNVASARANSNHYQAFNLGHLAAEGETNRVSSRIEMRLWDGTTDFKRIQTATSISLALVELSKHRINLNQEPQPSGHHREVFGREKLEGDAWTNATASFRKLMGLLKYAGLDSDAHQNNLVGLFAESRFPKRW